MSALYSHGVVVGVDDSGGGRAALAFAMREAARRNSSLHVVTAWTCGPLPVPDHPRAVLARQQAQQVQDDAVALTLSQVDARPVLSRQVIRGEAGEVLRRAAKDAACLVVGASRRQGKDAGTSFGDVGDYCVRHAPCAVVIVRAADPSVQELRGQHSSLGASFQP
jgi:nucleotide-binding universal stress UspA family protein